MSMSIIAVIGLCALVTITVRSLPILFLSHFEMPVLLRRWLAFIPPAIMAALIDAELISHPEIAPSGISISLLSTVSSTTAGLVSRGLFLTVVTGVVCFIGFILIL